MSAPLQQSARVAAGTPKADTSVARTCVPVAPATRLLRGAGNFAFKQYVAKYPLSCPLAPLPRFHYESLISGMSFHYESLSPFRP